MKTYEANKMNRTELMDQILKAFDAATPLTKRDILKESMKRMGDMDLLAFATELGVNPYLNEEAV